jgi:hypothetical protein
MLPRNYRSVAKELPFIWSKPGTDLGITSRQFECAWRCRLLDTVWVGGWFQIEVRLKCPRICNELQVQRIFGTTCGFLWSACRSDSRLHASKKRKNWERRRHHQLQLSPSHWTPIVYNLGFPLKHTSLNIFLKTQSIRSEALFSPSSILQLSFFPSTPKRI